MICWEQTLDDGMKAVCEFVGAGRYEVTVSRGNITLRRSFPATFQPIFGMDGVDADTSLYIAEELAQQLEKEENKNKGETT
jgi:hypothetical protein